MTEKTTDVDRLLEMSQAELDELFRASPAGDIPSGQGEGTVLVARGETLSEIAAKLAQYVAWQGKVFDPDNGELLNLVSPLGIRAVRAKVYKGDSWLDGAECIVLDYSETSLIAQWVRDEIREVAPGLYLGLVYWDHTRVLNFALRFPAPGP
ncbi:MAG: hypothetical protein ACM3ZF_00635 [Mycobacterium leprae]